MADKTVQVEVRGIRELATAFKKIDSDLPDEFKVAFLGIAERVVSKAQSGVPTISGRAAGSIKPRATTRGASVAFGGTAAPYFPWLDFGGTTGRGHGTGGGGSIMRPWLGRPNGEGRYVYPAISSERDNTAAAAEKAVTDVAARAGFETH